MGYMAVVFAFNFVVIAIYPIILNGWRGFWLMGFAYCYEYVNGFYNFRARRVVISIISQGLDIIESESKVIIDFVLRAVWIYYGDTTRLGTFLEVWVGWYLMSIQNL